MQLKTRHGRRARIAPLSYPVLRLGNNILAIPGATILATTDPPLHHAVGRQRPERIAQSAPPLTNKTFIFWSPLLCHPNRETASAGSSRGPRTTGDLTPAQRALEQTMRDRQFGRIENLRVEVDSPFLVAPGLYRFSVSKPSVPAGEVWCHQPAITIRAPPKGCLSQAVDRQVQHLHCRFQRGSNLEQYVHK
jgi:hypothetical protein